MWTGEGILMLFFQIPSRSSCAVCFLLSPFTQPGSTGTAHFRLLGELSHCKPHLQLPSQRLGRGSTLRISVSKASFGGLQLILAAAQWLHRAPWLLLHLAHPHLVLAWLCSRALLWTCLLSPLHLNLHSPSSLTLPSLSALQAPYSGDTVISAGVGGGAATPQLRSPFSPVDSMAKAMSDTPIYHGVSDYGVSNVSISFPEKRNSPVQGRHCVEGPLVT